MVITGLRPLKHYFIGLLRQAERKETVVLSSQTLFYLKSVVGLCTIANAKPIATFESLLLNQHNHCLATDASELGYGGWGISVFGKTFYFHGLWSDLDGFPTSMSIADLELWTHFMLVDCLLDHVLPGASAVCVRIDNMNALSWINHLRCRVDVSNNIHLDRLNWIRNYYLLNEHRGIEVQTSYIHTDLNVEADSLSRPGFKLTAYLASLPPDAQRIYIPKQWKKVWLEKPSSW